jgi:hypothetical protein
MRRANKVTYFLTWNFTYRLILARLTLLYFA